MVHRGAHLEPDCTEAVVKYMFAEEIWKREDAECAQRKCHCVR